MDKTIKDLIELSRAYSKLKKELQLSGESALGNSIYEYMDLSMKLVIQQSLDCQILLLDAEDLIDGKISMDEYKEAVNRDFGQLIKDCKKIASTFKSGQIPTDVKLEELLGGEDAEAATTEKVVASASKKVFN